MSDHHYNIYFYHKQEAGMHEKIRPLLNYANQNGLTLVNEFKKADIIVSIGDDGQFLQAVRKSGFRDDCLYIGVSTNGALSFYCDFHLQDTEKIIRSIAAKEMLERHYPTIEVMIDQQAPIYCLNEFSIQSAIVKTFIMDVYIDDLHFETFRGDGLIVSAPTGSTGYCKSVRGAVVDAEIPCIQVNELASINNNSYRTLGSPLILSKDRVLTLIVAQNGNDHPIMAMDNEALSTRTVKHVQVKLSHKEIKTVKLKDNSFWDKVKRTFL